MPKPRRQISKYL